MTDDTTVPPEDDAPPAASGFHIVPGVDEFLGLEERVALLEARIPAGIDDDDPDDDVLAGRLDRHRAEIEELKRRYNKLVKYLEAMRPTPAVAAQAVVPAAPVLAAPVNADDTIQPARPVVPVAVTATAFAGDMTDTGSLL